MYFLTETLISSVKRRTLAPTAQKTFEDSDIIELANEELGTTLVPDIMQVREDFFLKSESITLVGLVPSYNIPRRAIGDALKEVFFVDNSGTRRQLSRIDIHEFPTEIRTEKEPRFYTMMGDKIRVLPTPSTSVSGSLEVWYFERPNDLVATSQVTKITEISSTDGETTLTVDTDQSGAWSTSQKFDLLSAKSPFELWKKDFTLSSIGSSSITLPTSTFENEAGIVTAEVGDYLSLARTCNIPMVPQEFHPILAQMTAARLMEGLSHSEKLNAVNVKLAEMRKQAFSIISNRVENQTKHINSPYSLVNYSGGFGVGGSTRGT